MAKSGGGTRNYRNNPKALAIRKAEYDGLMATGSYDVSRSFFDPSGGFYITHKGHDTIADPNKDKSDVAVKYLAAKGYRVYLDNEKATISYNGKVKDGRIEKLPMDIKTANSAGKWTLKHDLDYAAQQGANAVVVMQNNPAVNKAYIIDQIGKMANYAKKQVDWVFVVGMNGSVHRHRVK